MAELQGLCSFPGIQQVVSATYTLSHGIQPGVCTVEMAPQAGGIATGGTLRFLFGSVELAFPDCRVDFATARYSEAGLIVSVAIFDRRWKWAFGEVSGEFNTRDGKGAMKNEKTPSELARKCLDAIGETADLSALPSEPRPPISWTLENPMRALAGLCDELGCRIVMNLDGSIAIRRAGIGGLLPTGGLIEQQAEANPPERPDTIRVIGAPTVVQVRIALEAVGKDKDGSIKRIDALSYKPTGGWGYESETFDNVANGDSARPNQSPRRLAIATVFRWYRVKESAVQALRIPEIEPIDALARILPLEREMVETYTDDGVEKPVPAGVYGVYWIGNIGQPINSVKGEASYRYRGDFDVDTELGIIRFAKPVRKWDGTSQLIEAELYADIAFQVRDVDGAPARYRFDHPMPGQPSGTRPYIVRQTGQDDATGKRAALQRRWWRNEDGTETSFADLANARDGIEVKARHYALGAIARFTPTPKATGRYAGLIPINPDGAIHQVTWTVGEQGATTEASLNFESSPVVVPYERRRFEERLVDLLKNKK